MSDYAARFAGLGTAVVADAAFRTGVSFEVADSVLVPLDQRSKLAGPAATVEANNDLVAILDAVHRSSPGDVVVIGNRIGPAALIGDLIGTEAVRRGLGGFVVDGPVRDSRALVDMGVTVICRGTYPVGPLKVDEKDKGIGEVGAALSIAGATVRPGDWTFGDADGVLFLASRSLDVVLAAAEEAERRERDLAARVAGGLALGDALRLDDFLEQRGEDSAADFNAHLAAGDEAI